MVCKRRQKREAVRAFTSWCAKWNRRLTPPRTGLETRRTPSNAPPVFRANSTPAPISCSEANYPAGFGLGLSLDKGRYATPDATRISQNAFPVSRYRHPMPEFRAEFPTLGAARFPNRRALRALSLSPSPLFYWRFLCVVAVPGIEPGFPE